MNIVLASKEIIPSTKTITVIGNSLGHDLLLRKGQYHHINTKTLVEGLGPCAKLTMWAGKDKFEAHSAPEIEPIQNVADNISKIIENLRGRLRNSFDEVHAFITGGIQYDSHNPVSQQSMDLLEEMYEALAKEGVPTTVIAAQKSDGLKTRLNSVSFKDNIFVYGKPIDNIINSKIQPLEDRLGEEFDFIELDNKIPIQIKE